MSNTVQKMKNELAKMVGKVDEYHTAMDNGHDDSSSFKRVISRHRNKAWNMGWDLGMSDEQIYAIIEEVKQELNKNK